MYESKEKMVTFISDDDLRNEDDILYKEISYSKKKLISYSISLFIVNSNNLNYSKNNKKYNNNSKKVLK